MQPMGDRHPYPDGYRAEKMCLPQASDEEDFGRVGQTGNGCNTVPPANDLLQSTVIPTHPNGWQMKGFCRILGPAHAQATMANITKAGEHTERCGVTLCIEK